jgi:hypothetical protein
VRVTLYYQATPPYYLNDRFEAAPNGDATKSLYYLASNLDLTGTDVENWKLPIATVGVPVTTAPPGAAPPSVIVSPAAQEQFQTAPVELKIRFTKPAQITVRATLNQHDVTSKFAPVGQGACNIGPCDFAAIVFPQDGLLRGRNSLRIVVRDANGLLAIMTRNFFVKGPKAVARADARVPVGQTITFDGSRSRSTLPLTYQWALVHKPEGSNATLLNPSSAKPSFVADVSGTYRARLVVHDGHFESRPDTVTVSVNEPRNKTQTQTFGQTTSRPSKQRRHEVLVQTGFQSRRHGDSR